MRAIVVHTPSRRIDAASPSDAVAPGRASPARRIAAVAIVGLPLVALATRVDVAIATWVHDHAFPFAAKQLLEVARLPGHFLFTLILAGLIATRSRDAAVGRARAALLVASTGAASLVAVTMKWLVGRTRPFRGAAPFDLAPLHGGPLGLFTQKNLSFPSGDATLAFATAATIALLFPRQRAIAFAWAAVVGIARVLQGAHYPSDVTAGAVLGIVMGWAIVALAAGSNAADARLRRARMRLKSSS